MNLAGLLTEHPFTDDEPLLVGPDEILTAGEARAEAAALATRLRSRGVQPGQAVAVQLPNGPRVVVAMVAIWLADAILVPINPRLTPTELAAALEATRPRALVGSTGVVERSAPTDYEPGVAFVTWTSGTTGPPKAILHTHDAYLELLDRVLDSLRAQRGDRARQPAPNLIPVSLALNAGIYNALFGLRAGASLVIMDRFEPERFAALVAQYQIRGTVLPPAAITSLADHPRVSDLAPLRYVRSITAPLSPLAAVRFTDKFGVTVLNGYGQAEIGEVIGWTVAEARAHPDKIGAVGRPHPGVTIELAPDGELLVRPPRRAVGYAGGGDLEDRVDDRGFVRTGDLARIDDDGFVWIEGRISDVINRGGNKVVPDQVEEVLRLVAGVTEVAVVGVPDDRLGEVPVAFVVAEPPVGERDVGMPEVGEMERVCREHLVAYKVPVEFVMIDRLPRTEVGKLARRELLARYQRLSRTRKRESGGGRGE